MKEVQIVNHSQSLTTPLIAAFCESFYCRLLGLSWRSSLANEHALVIVESAESRVGSSIHMLGMFFDLGIVWLNKEMEVVDARIAYRWRSFLLPAKPAQYVIELGLERIGEFSLGDKIEFKTLSLD